MAVNYGYDLSEESDWFTANITLIGKRPFPCSSTVSPPSLQISPDWSSGRTTPPCPSLPSSWMASSTSPPAHPRRRWTAVEEMVSVKCHFAKKKKKKTPGKANQSINPFVSNSNCVFVRGLLQLSADRSISVSLSAVKLPIV